MGGKHQVERPAKGNTPRTKKTKSKSGCSTCKIRRIKCDESRPACYKCVSTGRTCDGYGIWGGGGRAPGRQSIGLKESKNCSFVSRHVVPSFSLAETTEETGYFEWFICRTATKLPGIFASSFWDMLLLQASSSEPAVWHAVLALSSAHKMECLDGQPQRGKYTPLSEQEKFMLRQYSKAISHLLQPDTLPKNKTSIRVALVTCIVFICLELLRGRYKTAQAHLENGLKLLEEIEVSGTSLPNHYGQSTDDSIVESFSRIYSQVQLLMPSQKPGICLPIPEVELPTPLFQSMDQARQHLYLLLNGIFYLTERARRQGKFNPAGSSLELVDHQRRLRSKLASWLDTYKTSRTNFLAETTIRGKMAFAYELLHLYYTMASTMAHACLSPTDEWIYDAHTNDFVTMIIKSIHMRKTFPAISEALHEHNMDKSKTIMDMGWIPPLYYIAIKCRIHRVRLQAIKLLESTGPLHKEGIWDAAIVACVAKKVMEIEERDFYEHMHVDDDFEYCNPPEEQDFLLPMLPDSYRIHEVQVVLPDDPMGKIVLSCRQKQSDDSWVVLMEEYDMFSQLWIDRGEMNQ